MDCYVYILLCSDDSYYTGSTKELEIRLENHFTGKGANHTKKYPPQKVLYLEKYDRIDHAFYREKQIQGWTRAKKEALINGNIHHLKKLAECLMPQVTFTSTPLSDLAFVSVSSAPLSCIAFVLI